VFVVTVQKELFYLTVEISEGDFGSGSASPNTATVTLCVDWQVATGSSFKNVHCLKKQKNRG
jgi:hypothetical protein